ncbi:MAG: isochorismate synthase [Ignavibacteriaceae bacterium]
MEDFISRSVNSFSKFLSEKEDILNRSKSQNLVISFALPGDNFELTGKIDEFLNISERSFYLEHPESDFIVVAMDEILNITENGDGRFAITDKKIKEWKDRIVANHEIIKDRHVPLFIGAMKFTVEHSDNEWKDFNDSTWYVPKIIILKIGKEQFFIFNFLYSPKSNFYHLTDHLRSKLEYLYKIKGRVKTSELPKIRKIEGNTPKDKKKWNQMINQALESIEGGWVNKIVLARKVDVLLSGEMKFENVISRFRRDYKNCRLFVHRSGKSFFFGATPEVLGKFSNGKVEFDALAGSAPRGKDEKEDKEFEKKLLSSEKDKAEHNFVIDHIKNSLSPVCENITEKENFSVKKLSNIQHLHTVISAELKPGNSILNVLKVIYPTPAICGSPQNEALHLIKKLENFKRGLYSGIIGWFNFENEGDFVVALRSALCSGNKLTAFAGNGIVQNSEPDAEFAETELKLRPIMSLFR